VRRRVQTFLPDRPRGYLRQLPVFCPALSATVARAAAAPACHCATPMAEKARAPDLPDDWHGWFD